MASTHSSYSVSGTLHEPTDPAEHLRGTPLISAIFPDGRAFLDAFAPDRGPAGELTLATRARLPSDTPVVLEILWPALPNRIYVRATVARRRGGMTARLHPDEASVRTFLVRVARALPKSFHRRAHRRYCVRMLVRWRRFGDLKLADAKAEDLSAGGVLLATPDETPEVGERVSMRLLTQAAAQDLILSGRVRHVRRRGDDSVFGVQFEHRSSGEQRSLRRLLRVFAALGVVILE